MAMDQENFSHTGNHSHRETTDSHQASEQPQQPLRCANCDIDILWSPTVVWGSTYCCIGCAAGGPCCCDYSLYRSVTISGVIHYNPDHEALEQPSDKETS